MKIKRFNNLWAMGLILFGAILIAFYIAKIFFPEFIVGIAEIPSIVKFGEYVDSHEWAYYIVVPISSYISAFFLYGACCRVKNFSWKGHLIIVGFIVISLIFQKFLPKIYTPFNYVSLILQPFLILLIDNKLEKQTFISTCSCFSVDIMAQAISMQIRDVVILVTQVNYATLFVLMIDLLIWRILLYLFYNHKKGDK